MSIRPGPLTRTSSRSRTSGSTVNLDTEAQIVTSGVVAALAGKTLRSSLTPDVLAGAITVTVPANSTDLVITCKASTSTGAAACADAFAKAYLQHRDDAASSVIQQQIVPLKSRISSLQQTAAGLNTTVKSLPAGSSQEAAAQAHRISVQRQLTSLSKQVATLDGEATQTAAVPSSPRPTRQTNRPARKSRWSCPVGSARAVFGPDRRVLVGSAGQADPYRAGCGAVLWAAGVVEPAAEVAEPSGVAGLAAVADRPGVYRAGARGGRGAGRGQPRGDRGRG